jgi:hypothetical protein
MTASTNLIEEIDELLHLLPKGTDADSNVGVLAAASNPVGTHSLGSPTPGKHMQILIN